MKRTLLVLATVTTLILLSCNNLDNSNSLAEDVSHSKINALKKILTPDVAISTPRIDSITNCGPMSISASAGSTANSTMATCSFHSTPVSKITGVECNLGSSSGTGTVTPQSMWISLGGKSTTVSMTGSHATTSYFNGLVPPTLCNIFFTGKCTSGSCIRTYNYNSCIVYYEY